MKAIDLFVSKKIEFLGHTLSRTKVSILDQGEPRGTSILLFYEAEIPHDCLEGIDPNKEDRIAIFVKLETYYTPGRDFGWSKIDAGLQYYLGEGGGVIKIETFEATDLKRAEDAILARLEFLGQKLLPASSAREALEG